MLQTTGALDICQWTGRNCNRAMTSATPRPRCLHPTILGHDCIRRSLVGLGLRTGGRGGWTSHAAQQLHWGWPACCVLVGTVSPPHRALHTDVHQGQFAISWLKSSRLSKGTSGWRTCITNFFLYFPLQADAGSDDVPIAECSIGKPIIVVELAGP